MPGRRGGDKGVERRHLTEALRVLGVPSAGIEDSETPDFIVDTQDGAVGVEVTEFHALPAAPGKYPRRVIEEHWEELLQASWQYRREHPDLLPLHVSFAFDEMRLPPRREFSAFFDELAASVRPLLPGLGERMVENPRGTRRGFNRPLLTKYLRHFAVSRPGVNISWDWSGSVDAVGTTPEDIRRIVAGKAGKSYPSGLPLWLVVHGGINHSNYLEILGGEAELFRSAQLTETLDASPFSKVVLLCEDGPQVWSRADGWRAADH